MAGAEKRPHRSSRVDRDAGSGPAAVAPTSAMPHWRARMRRRGEESRCWWLVPTLYIVFLLLPIYWLINMSFKTNTEIVASLTL